MPSDKPYTLEGDFTPEKTHQLDEMLEDLYRRLGESETTVETAFPSGSPVDVTRWKKGPWTFDTVTPTPNICVVRPTLTAATAYHDFAPEGIDTAVEIELDLAGASSSITGIRHFERVSRKIAIINGDSTNSVTLTHESSSSTARWRLNLPSSTNIVLAPYEAAWMNYNITLERWQLMITPHSSGGLSSAGGTLKYATTTLDETELEALGVGSFVELVPAAANTGIHPIDLVFDNDVTDTYTNTPTWQLNRNSGAGNALITAISLTYSTGPRRQTYRTAMATNSDSDANFNGTNIGIVFSAALTGVGAATTRVHLWYTTFSTV